jgi:hypothetical protein
MRRKSVGRASVRNGRVLSGPPLSASDLPHSRLPSVAAADSLSVLPESSEAAFVTPVGSASFFSASSHSIPTSTEPGPLPDVPEAVPQHQDADIPTPHDPPTPSAPVNPAHAPESSHADTAPASPSVSAASKHTDPHPSLRPASATAALLPVPAAVSSSTRDPSSKSTPTKTVKFSVSEDPRTVGNSPAPVPMSPSAPHVPAVPSTPSATPTLTSTTLSSAAASVPRSTPTASMLASMFDFDASETESIGRSSVDAALLPSLLAARSTESLGSVEDDESPACYPWQQLSPAQRRTGMEARRRELLEEDLIHNPRARGEWLHLHWALTTDRSADPEGHTTPLTRATVQLCESSHPQLGALSRLTGAEASGPLASVGSDEVDATVGLGDEGAAQQGNMDTRQDSMDTAAARQGSIEAEPDVGEVGAEAGAGDGDGAGEVGAGNANVPTGGSKKSKKKRRGRK